MKPFDLEAALAGAPVVTRDGREVTQLVKFDVRIERHVYGVCEGSLNFWRLDGRYVAHKTNAKDLFMATPKKKLWLGIQTEAFDGGTHYTTRAYPEAAKPILDGYQFVEVEIDV